MVNKDCPRLLRKDACYGFYGLMMQWIAGGYEKSEEALIKDVIELTRTHIYAFEYIGKPLGIND